MSRLRWAATAAAAIAVAGTAIPAACAPDSKSPAVVAAISSAPKDDGSVGFLVSGQAAPVSAKVSQDTSMVGWCIHCQQTIRFRAADAAKSCAPCGCGMSNAACVVGAAPKDVTWQRMLQMLPRGTVLKVNYSEEGKPESGVKVLSVDRHSALLPLDAASTVSATQLADAAKAAGAGKAALLADGKQALLTLTATWTKDRESQFEQALAKVGAKLAPVESSADQRPK